LTSFEVEMTALKGNRLVILLFVAGCAPFAPTGSLNGDYRDRVKADLGRTQINPDGATFTFKGSPGVVNLGRHMVGNHYAWFVCGTVNSKDPDGDFTGPRPFISVIQNNVVIEREVGSSRAWDCAK
jgi:hypothetical protein